MVLLFQNSEDGKIILNQQMGTLTYLTKLKKKGKLKQEKYQEHPSDLILLCANQLQMEVLRFVPSHNFSLGETFDFLFSNDFLNSSELLFSMGQEMIVEVFIQNGKIYLSEGLKALSISMASYFLEVRSFSPCVLFLYL